MQQNVYFVADLSLLLMKYTSSLISIAKQCFFSSVLSYEPKAKRVPSKRYLRKPKEWSLRAYPHCATTLNKELFGGQNFDALVYILINGCWFCRLKSEHCWKTGNKASQKSTRWNDEEVDDPLIWPTLELPILIGTM